MLREQMISFLEATVVFLLLTNALSIFAATWAIYLAGRVDATPTAVHPRLKRFFAAWDQRRNAPLSTALRTRSN
jgi:hypothetical protein